jgi:putative DNA primase/helicase
MWIERGLDPPDEVTVARDAWRADSDPIGEFLAEACTVEAGASVPAGELYECYTRWCSRKSIEPSSQTLFGRILGDKGFGPSSPRERHRAVAYVFW